jgi:hypothetical protein
MLLINANLEEEYKLMMAKNNPGKMAISPRLAVLIIPIVE